MFAVPSFFSVSVAAAPLPVKCLAALSSIEVETSLERAGIFRLRFDLSRTALGDWDVLQLDIFLPKAPVSIRVRPGGGLAETIINGYVSDSGMNNRTSGSSSLEVVGMDATATLMNLPTNPFSWPNSADSVIAATIFGKYGIIPDVDVTPPTRTSVRTTTTQRATDIRFLKERARAHSFECYVLPDRLLGVDTGRFGAARLSAPAQGVLSVDFGMATNLTNFNVRYASLQPRSARAEAIDPDSGSAGSAAAVSSSEPAMGAEPTLARITPAPEERVTGSDAVNNSELSQSAQSVVDRSSRCIQASGDVDALKFGGILRPGVPVMVRGAGAKHSGKYYVTEVSHSISRDHYTQRFSAWRNAVGLSGTEVFAEPSMAGM